MAKSKEIANSKKADVVARNEKIAPKDSKLGKAFTIRVTDKGEPCKEALVRVHVPNVRQLFVARTNKKGEAVFYGLQNNTDYKLSVQYKGGSIKNVVFRFRNNLYDFDWSGYQTTNTATIVFIAKDGMADFDGLGVESLESGNLLTDTTTAGRCSFIYDVPAQGTIAVLTYTNPVTNISSTISVSIPTSGTEITVIVQLN